MLAVPFVRGDPTVTPGTPRNDGVYTHQSPWWHVMMVGDWLTKNIGEKWGEQVKEEGIIHVEGLTSSHRIPYKPANFCWDGRSVSVYTRIPIFVWWKYHLLTLLISPSSGRTQPRLSRTHLSNFSCVLRHLKKGNKTLNYFILGLGRVHENKFTKCFQINPTFKKFEPSISTIFCRTLISRRATSGPAVIISWFPGSSTDNLFSIIMAYRYMYYRVVESLVNNFPGFNN